VFGSLLIERKEVVDPDYVLDEHGKACYVKGRGRGRERREGCVLSRHLRAADAGMHRDPQQDW
jgi:hypothetical protein